MILPEATLQAIIDLQEHGYIIGIPEVIITDTLGKQVAHVTVFVPEQFSGLNLYMDLIHSTLENTSTDDFQIEVIPEFCVQPQPMDSNDT